MFYPAEQEYGPTEPREYFPEYNQCHSETSVSGDGVTTEETFHPDNVAAYWDPASANTGEASLLASNTSNWDVTGTNGTLDNHHRLYRLAQYAG